ncbi:MAG: GNAT family N-acetyltransferase [Stackebrandtia sp.]
MLIRPATPADVPRLLGLRDEAARWLASKGSDQWASDWPNPDTMVDTIRQAVAAGQTWCVETGDQVIATITLDNTIYPGLWTPNELAEPARYAHRVIVDRDHAGASLGSELLDWAGTQAVAAGATWLRVDVWTTNTELQDYYRQQGFTHVRTVVRDDYPSGALFQRPAEVRPTPRLRMSASSR